MEKNVRYSLIMTSTEEKKYYTLKDIPYLVYGDMLIAIRNIIEESPDIMKWKYVTNEDLKAMRMTFQEMYDVAYAADEEHGFVVREMTDLISKNPLLRRKTAKKYKDLPKEQKVFILSNKENTNGATAILHDSFLKKVEKMLGTKLIIAPVSTHHVLCISEKASQYLKTNLKGMLASKQTKAISEEMIIF